MSVLLYLVPAALSLGLLGLVAFLWSLRAGQYDDMEGAAVRVLSDDDLDDRVYDRLDDGVRDRPRRRAGQGSRRG